MTFSYLAIHHPKPEYRAALLESMGRVDVASRSAEGLVSIGPWAEIDGERIIGISVWESRAHFVAAGPAIWAVVADDPFDLWEREPVVDFELESI